jgi:1-acyl-sn-glycerol-3-phosphate acyltransferase
MFILKAALLFLAIICYIINAWIIKFILCFNFALRLRALSCWTRLFNRFLVFFLGIKVVLEGGRLYPQERGTFIISNHLGYLDGIILASLFNIVFVSKSEVKSWPLFGWMTSASGAIFIDRKRKNKSADYIREASAALEKKINLLVFPEGTSTNGERLSPFQSVHFQSPINAGSPILPLNITYTKINGRQVSPENRDKVCWYGQVKFFSHILGAFKLRRIEAKVVIHPKLESEFILQNGCSRKDVSRLTQEIISRAYPLF